MEDLLEYGVEYVVMDLDETSWRPLPVVVYVVAGLLASSGLLVGLAVGLMA